MMQAWSTRRAAATAAAWVAREDAGTLEEEQRHALQRWLDESQLHRDEYEAARRIFSQAAQLEARVLLQALTAESAGRRPAPSGRIVAWLATAAVLCAAVVWSYTFVSPEPQIFSTATGERRELRLPDGSKVLLNTNSRLRVSRWGTTRSVELERGEAFFAVARDENRPFIARAGGGALRVLGTKFNVRLDDAGTTLAVIEGRVELSLLAQQGRAAARHVFAAGEGTIYGPHDAALSAQQLQIDRITAWRTGKFIFDGTPLNEVVREINRYSANKVTIADPGLEGLRISGTFPTDRIPDLLQMLEKAAPVHVVARSDTILLVAR